MFGFFDRKEAKKQAALQEFRNKMRSTETTEQIWRNNLLQTIVQRTGVLHNTGNREEAKKEAGRLLEEYIALWDKNHDPRDLHFLVEGYRAARFPQTGAELALLGIEEKSCPKDFDKTWAHIDLGLCAHQMGFPIEQQMPHFIKAINAVAPEAAKVKAGPEIKARAAYLGFVLAITSNNPEAGKYLTLLKRWEPERDWDNPETLEVFRKTFIGFMSPDT